MHKGMVYTLSKMSTCIPKLPGSYKVKKGEGRGVGRVGDGQGVCSGAIDPKSSLRDVYRWWIMGKHLGGLLERKGWGYGGEYGGMVSGR